VSRPPSTRPPSQGQPQNPTPQALPTTPVSPNQGNTQAPQTTPPPTTYDQSKPPNIYNVNPSISSVPSISPTVEPPCLSTTSGSVRFENKYIALKLSVTDITSTNLSQNDTDTILADIVDAYNIVARCDQDGASRQIDQAILHRVTGAFPSSSSTTVEWIIRVTGTCDGCIDSADALFNEDPINNQSPPSILDTSWLETTANGTAPHSKPCYCPGPSFSMFQEMFNELHQANSTDTVTMSTAVELANEQSCDTAMIQGNLLAPQQFSTLVTFVVKEDPSTMTNTELQSIYDSFSKIVTSHLSLTYPTCDLAQKQIVDVQRDSDSPTIGRDLRRNSQVRRRMKQTIADFELVLNVTFTCFGCEGQLFGATNYTPTIDCLCPKDGNRYGVDEQGIVSPLNDALTDLSIGLSIVDIIEIEPVPCSSNINEFSTVVVIEYLLKSNDTTPTADDLALVGDEFVAGYNGMARRCCDPYFRRISSAETLMP